MTIHEIESDSTLIAMAKEGSPAAIDELVRTFWPVAYRTAVCILRCHADAEEVAQDVVFSAITHLSSFRGDSSFRTWFHRIAINHSLMSLRRKHARDHLSSTIPLEAIAPAIGGPRTPEQLLLEAECQSLVQEGLEQVPGSYATILRLGACDGKSMHEIASLAGLSVAAVKTRMHRGRAHLRREISLRLYSKATAKDEPGSRSQQQGEAAKCWIAA
jgi:RNA polymerase sigma-70 factor (ECF subfamily)